MINMKTMRLIQKNVNSANKGKTVIDTHYCCDPVSVSKCKTVSVSLLNARSLNSVNTKSNKLVQ